MNASARRLRQPRLLLAFLATLALLAAACGSDGDDDNAAGGDSTTTAGSGSGNADDDSDDNDDSDDAGGNAEPVTLRLGHFPNVTHAPAIIGVENGLFDAAVGDHVTIEVNHFSVGNDVIDAFFANALDISFIGPNPAISGWARSEGTALHIIAGTTSAGASLVVHPDITSIEDLRGKTIATPAVGNTQDVAARAYFAEQGLENDTAGGGDISIIGVSNADSFTAFTQGDIDGAWVPEPWATRFQLDGGAVEFLNESEIWPNGDFVTTHVIVRTAFLEEHPDVVESFLEGLVAAIDFAADPANTEEAQQITNDGIEAITGNRLADEVIAGAWGNLRFTPDPIASSLQKSADDAIGAGLLDEVDLTGIYALDILNRILTANGGTPVEGL